MGVVTVADVLALPLVRAAAPEVLTGGRGLTRHVRWVHSAELADIAPLLRDGDLLLSTGIAMPEPGPELEEYAASLAETGAAGLMIELGRRWDRVPESLVQACDRHGLPLVALTREVRFAAVAQAVGERIVDEQVDELREAQRVHDTFTQLSVAEAGPREILEAVQRLAGTAVVLESEQHQVLDYQAGSDDISNLLTNWAVRSRSVRSDEQTVWDEASGWLVSRVGKRDRGWGRLVVQTADAPSARRVAVIERAAAALALHRLHDRQRDSAVRRTHHELLVGLLADPSSPDLLRRCELAGVPTERRQLVGITLRPLIGKSARTADPVSLREEVIAATVHAAHEQGVPALVCELDQDARALLSFPATGTTKFSVDQLAERVRRRHPVVVGAGRPVTKSTEIDRTLRESQHVVQSAPADSDLTIHRLEDVHLRGLLAMLTDDDRVRLFVDRELSPLRDHDENHGTGLLEAVRALLNHPMSKSEAAASLHMSRPVFYDRLAKASRLLGIDLDDPDIRTSLHVAMMADEATDRAG